MMTASFGSPGLDLLDKRLVSIARYPPRGWRGRRYPPLYPPRDLLKLWLAGKIGPAIYQFRYERECLSRLNPSQVLADLGEDAILLCWCRPSAFCHRRLVADWLAGQLGITVPEWTQKEGA